jgi:sugar phosphate isomerase/epimerase
MGQIEIGVQLYTLRNEMSIDVEKTLREVAKLGFTGVEFAGYYGWSGHQLKQLLDELGLQAIGCHVSIQNLREDLQGEIDTLRTLGAHYLICPYIGVDDRSSADDWLRIITDLHQVGEEAFNQGLQFLYHNHDFEFHTRINNEFVFDVIYQSTSPSHVHVELDVCWVQYAGQDPIAYIHKYAGRLPIIHAKDFNKHADGRIQTLELGLGEVPLDAVIAASKQAGVKWFVIEQDVCQKETFVSIANSLKWLKSKDLSI